MKSIFSIAALTAVSTQLSINHDSLCPVQYQWGGSSAPWNNGGLWILGRQSQDIEDINISSNDGGKTFSGTVQYSGEGPIGFKAVQATGNSYNVQNQWGGSSAPWNDAGFWIIGDRDTQRITAVDVSGKGNSLQGTVQYVGEGPIGFKSQCQ